MPGLGTSFGRGGATTAQQDLANADAILIMGSSMAENHPVGFQWVIEAREKNGAKIIHVDPRFNRTSAMADYWLPLRAGSDLVFLGALIHYTLANERYFRDYVVHYTNAPAILRSDFKDTEDLGGLFSGWDGKKYDPETWLYEGAELDRTLEHPRCVFQVLKRHFARYTPELVEQLCGIPKEGIRPRQYRRDLLRGRMDAALDRSANHPRRLDSPTSPRQHRAAGRRHPRAARSRFDSRLD